ncbi:hypothetical protein KZ820_18615 [Sphingomonas sp. RRHST34]|uniref:Uncharacterized protein n=1 Tax=Sphingomonas citri TaxID=2862499 RepID=A0ABS7BT56_9SPHN|nr:hypothetical protein [Sphingomonas citri]MBW6532761.1 hypothetical protein [Sphingomonas citri]
MTSAETTIVLDDATASAIRLMLSKLDEQDVAVVFEMVGGTGPIGDLAAEAMKDRNIDL